MFTKRLELLADHKFRAHRAVKLDDKRSFAILQGVVDTLKLYECEKSKSNLPMPGFSGMVPNMRRYEVSFGEKTNVCAVFRFTNYREHLKEDKEKYPFGTPAFSYYPVMYNDGYDLTDVMDACYVGFPKHSYDLLKEFLGYIFEDVYDHSQWDHEKNKKIAPPREIAVIVYIDERMYNERKG